MTKEIKDFIKLCNEYWDKPYGIGFIDAMIIIGYFQFVIKSIPLESVIYPYREVIIYIFCLLITLFWLYNKSYYPKGKKGKINIALAIYDDKETEEPIQKDIEKRFIKIMDDNEFLSKKLNIIKIDKYKAKQIKKRSIAEKYSVQKKWNLLIWGDGKIYDDKYIFDIAFTNIFANEPYSINYMRNRGLEALYRKNWQLSSNSKFNEILKTVDNLREVSLYLLGCACLVSFEGEDAQKIFYILYNLIKSNTEKLKNDQGVQLMFRKIPLLISDSFNCLAIIKYCEELNSIEASNLIEEGLSWHASNVLLLNKAYLNYLNTKTVDLGLINSIRDKNPKRYFLAFKSMMEDKMEEGYDLYIKAFNKTYYYREVVTEIFFINNFIQKYQDKIQCLFILGMFYKYKLNKNGIAKKYFKQFAKLSKNQEKYKFLMEKSKILIN